MLISFSLPMHYTIIIHIRHFLHKKRHSVLMFCWPCISV